MRDKTEQRLSLVLDVMNGADGGVDFAFFLKFLRMLDKRAEEGDTQAESIIELSLGRFCKLIKVSQKVAQNAIDNS